MVEINEIAERINSWFNKKPMPPYKVDFFLTERCNLRCLFCNFPFVSKERLKKELTEKELLKIVDFCGKNDVKIIGILGGEPFVRKKVLLKLMKRIKKYGIDGSIVTNGTLLDDKTILELVKIEWDLIRFSIDGMKKTHEFLRGKTGIFETIIEAIKRINEVKKKFKKNKPTIEINTVLCNKNYREMSSIIRLASSLGCNYVYVLPMIEFTEASKKLRIKNVKKARKYLLEAKKLAEKLKVGTNLGEVIESELITKSNKMNEVILPKEKVSDKNYIPCFLPWYTMSIDAVGNVTPCSNMSPIGENIRKKSLKKIWFGKKFNKIRKAMVEKNLPEDCSKCCVPLVDENRILREKLGLLWKRK